MADYTGYNDDDLTEIAMAVCGEQFRRQVRASTLGQIIQTIDQYRDVDGDLATLQTEVCDYIASLVDSA